MTFPIAASKAGRRRWGKKQAVAAACGVALTVAGAAGVGTWQVAAHGGTNKPSAASSQHAATGGRRPFGGTWADESLTYYLVSTQSQANGLQAELGEQNNVGALAGGTPLAAVIVMATAPEEEAQARMAIAEQTPLRAAAGLPPIQVIDLRTP